MARRLSTRWAGRILRLYPRPWRDRYGEEMAVVLRQHDVTPRTLANLLGGALDAHLHSGIIVAESDVALRRMRGSELAIFCAFVLFAAAWAPLQNIRDPLADWHAAVHAHPQFRVLLDVIDGAGLIALLAVVVGGVPILTVALVSAIREKRRDLLRLWLVPPTAFGALVVYAVCAVPASTSRQGTAPNAPLTPLAAILQLGLLALFMVAVVASTATVVVAVARSDVGERLIRFALVPAGIIAVAIGIALGGTPALGILIAVSAPWLLSLSLLFPIVAMMSGATGLASVAIRRAFSARHLLPSR